MQSGKARPPWRNELAQFLMRRTLLVVILDVFFGFEGCHRHNGVSLAAFLGGVEDAVGFVGDDVFLAVLEIETRLLDKATAERWTKRVRREAERRRRT